MTPEEKIKRKQHHAADPTGRLWRMARTRARQKGLEFTIRRSDVRVPDICPVLGIEIYVSERGPRTNHSPSIDRINNAQGYVPGNVIVISWRANRLKSDATIEELQKIANFYKSST